MRNLSGLSVVAVVIAALLGVEPAPPARAGQARAGRTRPTIAMRLNATAEPNRHWTGPSILPLSGWPARWPNPIGELTPASETWSLTHGSTGGDFIAAIAVDHAGNSYVVGSLAGTADLGCGAMSPTGSLDMYVVSYDTTGSCRWSRHFGGTSEQWATALVRDCDGNLFVTGVFSGTTDFGFGALASAGGYDGFVAELSPTGAPVWARAFGGAEDDAPSGVAVAAADIVVAGHFHGTASFGGADLVSAGGADAFLARYAATDGAHVWSMREGGAAYDAFYTVSTLDSGLVVSGAFAGTSNFGGSDLASAGSKDGLLAGYTLSGAHSWSRRFGESGDDSAMSATTTPDGGIALSARFQGTVDFSDGAGAPLAANGSYAAAVVRYSSAGDFTWSTMIDATGLVFSPGIVVDADGNIVVTGSFEGTVTLPRVGAVAAKGTDDSFIARFDSSGKGTWATTLAGSGSSEGITLASSCANTVVVGGYFGSSIDLGGGAVSSVGGTDFWLKATATQ